MKLREQLIEDLLTYSVDENYKEVLTCYHMIFGQKIDDNSHGARGGLGQFWEDQMNLLVFGQFRYAE